MYKSDYMLETPLEPAPLTMEQCAGLGNQQENEDALKTFTVEEAKLASARLAMFFDTDGFITIQVRQMHGVRDASVFPHMGLVNTSQALIEWADESLHRMVCAHYLKWFTVDQMKGSKARKPQGRIVIQGLHRCLDLLSYIQPYLVGKRRQGELVMEFIQSRLQADHKARYSDRELEIANEIRSLNSNKSGEWRPISSETVRRTSELRAHLKNPKKIQAELLRKMQSTAEMTVPVLN